MAWNYENSKNRLSEERKRLDKAGFTVKKLTREMDLSNLGLTEARLVHGVHSYANIANYSEILDDPLLRRDDSKRLHRYLHVIRVEQRRIMQSVFDGDKIQVQGPKFHGLLYKPYDNDRDLAWNSVLAGVALHCVLTRATPQVFESYPKLDSVIGLDLGDVVVANVGLRGDRELISVGSPANHAAKIHGEPNSLTVGKRICFGNVALRYRPSSTARIDTAIKSATTGCSGGCTLRHASARMANWPSRAIVTTRAASTMALATAANYSTLDG